MKLFGQPFPARSIIDDIACAVDGHTFGPRRYPSRRDSRRCVCCGERWEHVLAANPTGFVYLFRDPLTNAVATRKCGIQMLPWGRSDSLSWPSLTT